jgi:hypothetical protein
MKYARCTSRRGLTATELIVAATLLVGVISLIAPLTVRIGRIWQDARQFRLATNELSNQLELLTGQSTEQRNVSLLELQPSPELHEALPGARLTGETIGDEDGLRIALTIEWDRAPGSKTLTLVGWVDGGLSQRDATALTELSEVSGRLAISTGAQP